MEKENKILFQISYDVEEDSYKYITNQMTNQEFLAFLCFLSMVKQKFEETTFDEMMGDILSDRFDEGEN